jgi:hypothetical protein
VNYFSPATSRKAADHTARKLGVKGVGEDQKKFLENPDIMVTFYLNWEVVPIVDKTAKRMRSITKREHVLLSEAKAKG